MSSKMYTGIVIHIIQNTEKRTTEVSMSIKKKKSDSNVIQNWIYRIL